MQAEFTVTEFVSSGRVTGKKKRTITTLKLLVMARMGSHIV